MLALQVALFGIDYRLREDRLPVGHHFFSPSVVACSALLLQLVLRNAKVCLPVPHVAAYRISQK